MINILCVNFHSQRSPTHLKACISKILFLTWCPSSSSCMAGKFRFSGVNLTEIKVADIWMLFCWNTWDWLSLSWLIIWTGDSTLFWHQLGSESVNGWAGGELSVGSIWKDDNKNFSIFILLCTCIGSSLTDHSGGGGSRTRSLSGTSLSSSTGAGSANCCFSTGLSFCAFPISEWFSSWLKSSGNKLLHFSKI